MATLWITTLFDSKYAKLGLSMLESVNAMAQRAGGDVYAHVLALDGATAKLLNELRPCPLAVHSIDDLIADPLISRGVVASRSRSRRAFCWGLASVFTDWVARTVAPKIGPDVFLTYVDSDVYFFGSPFAVTDEMKDASIGVQPHRLPPWEMARLGGNGRFNVGVVTFRMDQVGRGCLSHWAQQCLDWCDEGQGDRAKFQYCGDQGYLDEWPSRYGERFHEFKNPGLSLAPWNLPLHRIGPGPTIDGGPPTLYHFHEFRDKNFLSGYPLRAEDREHVYAPYIQKTESWRGAVEWAIKTTGA